MKDRKRNWGLGCEDLCRILVHNPRPQKIEAEIFEQVLETFFFASVCEFKKKSIPMKNSVVGAPKRNFLHYLLF